MLGLAVVMLGRGRLSCYALGTIHSSITHSQECKGEGRVGSCLKSKLDKGGKTSQCKYQTVE
eukprot:6427584-Pyramimonas_sp.AAC.1